MKQGKRYKRDPLMRSSSENTPNGDIIWRMLGPVDEVARKAEAKWGIERLPELVPVDLARRFGEARQQLNDCIEDGNLDKIEAAAEIVRRAWGKLDEVATASGAAPADTLAWSFMVGSERSWVVRDPAAARQAQQMNPGDAIYTLDEIGRLVGAAIGTIAPAIAETMNLFPGATVAAVTPRPLSSIGEAIDDEIPF